MILKIHNCEKNSFPEELLKPTFYVNEEENEFIKEKWEDRELKVSCELEINQLNFFIGANNSGKSRFMRGLLKLESFGSYLADKRFYLDISKEMERVNIKPSEYYEKFSVEFVNESIKNLIPENVNIINNFKESDNKNLTNEIENITKLLYDVSLDLRLLEDLRYYILKAEEFQKEINFSKKHKISKKSYTPVLRSLLNNLSLKEKTFKDTIEGRYFGAIGDFTKNNDIHTGLELWEKIDDVIGSEKAQDIRDFEEFLSVIFFEGEKIILSPHKKEKIIYLNFEKQGYKGIHEIGDGIQALILLLFPIFTANKNEVFFIEEPEINLHPGFQRIFMETLLTNEFLQKKNLKYFFTTHSNHFLDLTLKNDKVSFFQFQKLEEGKHLIKTNIKPNKETLDLLGVNTSSVLLANASLWVEGPTDRIYLSKFLKLYCEKEKIPYLKEDIDFAFFEYGGNLIAHYLFKGSDQEINDVDENEVRDKINSFALSNKIYLLADNDNPKKDSAKDKRQQELINISTSNKNFQYQNTNVKEIENLLPVKIIRDFMKEILTDEKTIQQAQIIQFTMKDYENKGLGKFYEELFDNNIQANYRRAFKAKSGTLESGYKTKLANFVMESNYTYEELIKDNKNLDNIIKNLYNFIKP